MKTTTRGLIIVNTGNGKGKTTAALGLMMRAWGHGKKVVMLQFIKKSTANYGEHKAARRMGIELIAGGAGFVRSEKDVEKGREMAVGQWRVASEKINSGDYDLVVLDELSYPLRFGWITVGEVLDALGNRPPAVHVVISGRDMPAEIVEVADTVTEMREVKHAMSQGIKAQPGIEF